MIEKIKDAVKKALNIELYPIPAPGTPHIYLTVFVDRIGAEDKAWLYLGKHDGSRNGQYKGSGRHLKAAIEKYGAEHFLTFCLEVVSEYAVGGFVCAEEEAWLTKFDAAKSPIFFNLVNAGGGGKEAAALGIEASREANKRIWQEPAFRERNAAATREKWKDPSFRERNAAANRNMLAKRLEDEDYRARMSEVAKKNNQRLWQNTEFRENMAEGMRIRNEAIWSNDQFRERMASQMSKKAKILWSDDEYREKMSSINSKAMTKRWEDPEFRKAATEAVRDRSESLWKDEEFRKHFSETKREMWKDEEFRKLKQAVSRLPSRIIHVESGRDFRSLTSLQKEQPALFVSLREMQAIRAEINKAAVNGEWITVGSRTGNSFRLLFDPRQPLTN